MLPEYGRSESIRGTAGESGGQRTSRPAGGRGRTGPIRGGIFRERLCAVYGGREASVDGQARTGNVRAMVQRSFAGAFCLFGTARRIYSQGGHEAATTGMECLPWRSAPPLRLRNSWSATRSQPCSPGCPRRDDERCAIVPCSSFCTTQAHGCRKLPTCASSSSISSVDHARGSMARAASGAPALSGMKRHGCSGIGGAKARAPVWRDDEAMLAWLASL